MLYLFGRLALSNSYYFNEDFQADEYPENQVWDQRCPTPDSDARPAPVGESVPPHAPTKKPAAELQQQAF